MRFLAEPFDLTKGNTDCRAVPEISLLRGAVLGLDIVHALIAEAEAMHEARSPAEAELADGIITAVYVAQWH